MHEVIPTGNNKEDAEHNDKYAPYPAQESDSRRLNQYISLKVRSAPVARSNADSEQRQVFVGE
jgi:hypothetical protein